MRDEVFISYSHKDIRWLNALTDHLKPYIRQDLIKTWDDRKIRGGQLWRQEIQQALARAGTAVLLVTPNFLASDFIANEELPPLLEAAQKEGLKVLWVAVSASSYKVTKLASYQAANTPDQPVDSLRGSARNKVWVNICEQIADAPSTSPVTDSNLAVNTVRKQITPTATSGGSIETEPELIPLKKDSQPQIDASSPIAGFPLVTTALLAATLVSVVGFLVWLRLHSNDNVPQHVVFTPTLAPSTTTTPSFPIAPTLEPLKMEPIIFSPAPPARTERVAIYACTAGLGGVDIALRVSINTATDGTDTGDWKILKELGVPCFSQVDAPIWDTRNLKPGKYLVKAEARGPDDPQWERAIVATAVYTLLK